jgi:DNA-binding NarL/FixJ family response regulator
MSTLPAERIVIADDHPLFREGLCRLVGGAFPEADILQAGTIDELRALVASGEAPALFILDLMFPGMDPQATIAQIRSDFPTSSLVVISMSDDPATIDSVVRQGADGYITKSAEPAAMLSSIQSVIAGETVVLAPAAPAMAASRLASPSIRDITPRQRDVLSQLAMGKTNKEIGRHLDISPFTVRIHVSALLRTLGAQSRTEAAVKARAMGIERTG